ncbi:CDAN1-interacting nuclease 1 isoform X2 [Pieris napi]|uniref:CDAN1-interacting nuclease 1 isoform X2 n=1 Tax=Pieris napi TaxID=78633 RepID=UPI001FB928A2|nr:CDAN1-interacting nuclease 1 isoform X2 [Pieris napi]
MLSQIESKPMPYKLYLAIVEDFNKLTSFSRKAENMIRKKYKDIPSTTIGSIISMLVQRSMKLSYRKSPVISSRYYDLYENLIKKEDKNWLIVKGIMHDNQYGPYADIIKQSIGLEYELRLEQELKTMNITFSDESILRLRGYDKTPDFKLDVPIAVDGFVVNWIESKALFGDEENHLGYLKEQLICYWNRFGPGLVIYWFGYLETLENTPEVNSMFILRTKFPSKDTITQYKIDM